MTVRAAAAPSSGPGPWAGLLGRYAAVASAAWRQRHAMAGVTRSADEQAFLPAALSLQETPAHPAPRRVAWLLMALFGLALAWAWFGTVDIVAIAAGRVVVDDRNKLIAPLERSLVRRVLVRDGDRVAPDQPLVELDATTIVADKTSVLEQMRAALSEELRTRLLQQALQAVQPRPPQLSPSDLQEGDAQGAASELAGLLARQHSAIQLQLADEWNDIAARQARLAAELRRRQAEIATAQALIDKLEATLPLVRQREDDMRALSEQGFVSHHVGQDRTRERVEMERDLLAQRARLQEAMASHAETVSGQASLLAETRHDLSERHAQAGLRLQQARQELAKAQQRERLTVLRSPVAGVVQQLATHTTGGVVTEAQTLMVIVPDGLKDDPVVAEVTLDNKDIGFVHAGQTAEVKLETFLFTRYGTVPATVQRVTADAVNDEHRGAIFPARLVLARSAIDVDGHQVRLGPGMNVTAEIKTGRRRVIEFLISPLLKAGSESLRER